MVANLFVGVINWVEMEGELKKYLVVSWLIDNDGLKIISFLDKSIVFPYSKLIVS
jgi:hypothetical protein